VGGRLWAGGGGARPLPPPPPPPRANKNKSRSAHCPLVDRTAPRQQRTTSQTSRANEARRSREPERRGRTRWVRVAWHHPCRADLVPHGIPSISPAAGGKITREDVGAAGPAAGGSEHVTSSDQAHRAKSLYGRRGWDSPPHKPTRPRNKTKAEPSQSQARGQARPDS
jgi:hypothetical protein